MSFPDKIYIDMGNRITECRKELDWTQEVLAELADVSPQLISTAERGTKALRPENLLKISRVLEVSTDYLLTGEVIDRDLGIINDKLKHLSSKQIKIIEKIIDNCIELNENK